MMDVCECSDPGCPGCGGYCLSLATTRVRRIDMEGGLTSFAFCEPCTDDALESGVFAVVDGDDDD